MSVAVGDSKTLGTWDFEIAQELLNDDDITAYVARTTDDNLVILGEGPTAWGQTAERVLRSFRPGLPRVLATESYPDRIQILLEGPPVGAEPFDDEVWRRLDRKLAVHGLRTLTQAIAQLHGATAWLHGIKRHELLLNSTIGTISVAAMPRLRINSRPSAEAPWRDMRLVGELAYEVFLDDDYPGGHQMAAILQDRVAIGDLGITFPGLPQLLAGCVSPYGDLAYKAAADLHGGLDQLEIELDRPWSFQVGAASTVGNYIFRKNNQDSCGHIAVQSICGSRKVSLGFFCVVDGIGGIQDGERASRLAVEAACEAFGRGWAAYGADRVIQHPIEFSRAIAKVVGQRLALEGEFEPDNNRGGTTFSGLLIAGDRAAVCHVGDSRITLARGGELIQLTHDHTLASILIQLGELTEEEAESHELSQRTISRFLSTSAEVELDRVDAFGPQARDAFGAAIMQHGMEVRPGDVFILTSDGAHGELTRQALALLADDYGHAPQELCDAAIANALKRIGRDNSTMLVVRID